MIKTIKKFQIKLTPFDATKTWNMSTINNENLLLYDTGSYTDPEVPVALEFIDYGSSNDDPFINFECNIALEQQEDDLVNVRDGLKISGLFYPELDPINKDGTYKRAVYSQINTMFYNNSKNPTQIWGMNNIDFELSKTKRHLSDEFKLFDIPGNIYGDKIVPKSIVIQDYTINENFSITDDGFRNLIAGTNLFSKFQILGKFNNVFTSGSNSICDLYWSPIYGEINPPAPVDDNIYDLSGSVWLLGAVETFLGYDEGSIPTNKGYGWDGPWVITKKITKQLMVSDLLSEDGLSEYTSGSIISGSYTGKGWPEPWNEIVE